MGILNRFMKNFIHFVVLFLKIFNKIQFKSQKYLKHPGCGVHFSIVMTRTSTICQNSERVVALTMYSPSKNVSSTWLILDGGRERTQKRNMHSLRRAHLRVKQQNYEDFYNVWLHRENKYANFIYNLHGMYFWEIRL